MKNNKSYFSKISQNIDKYSTNPKVFSFEISDSEKVLKQRLNSKQKFSTNKSNNTIKNPTTTPPVEDTQEYNPFRKVNLYILPDSKRTVNPELGPESTILKRNYSKNNYDFSENRNKFANLIGKTSNEEKITNCARATNPKVYNSFNFRDLSSVSENAQPKRREKSQGIFSKYDSTTQIHGLPGGIKRDFNDIDDDEKSYNRLGNKSYYAKLIKDYKSNISCLPGKMINDEKKEKTRLVLSKKFESNNIFANEENSASKSVNTDYSFRRTNKCYKNAFQPSQQEKDIFESRKSKKPDSIKNLFQSQITVIK